MVAAKAGKSHKTSLRVTQVVDLFDPSMTDYVIDHSWQVIERHLIKAAGKHNKIILKKSAVNIYS